MDTLKHGLAAGDAGRPESADWTVPQHWERYTAADHATWRTLYQRQMALLPQRACQAYVDGMRALPMRADHIPNFDELNAALKPRTGWEVVAVAGLVPHDVFFEHLANRRFPAGQFIRQPDQLDYLEEPDVFHDVFGHVPLLMNPVMADFMQAYGIGGQRAQQLGHIDLLARVYWYTVEFGLVREAQGLRIYGAGIASSYTESVFSLDSPSPNRLRFQLPRVMRTQFRIDDFQESYFVLDSLDELLELARVDFAPLYEHVSALTLLEPGDVLDSDEVLSRGNGTYHAAKRCEAHALSAGND